MAYCRAVYWWRHPVGAASSALAPRYSKRSDWAAWMLNAAGLASAVGMLQLEHHAAQPKKA